MNPPLQSPYIAEEQLQAIRQQWQQSLQEITASLASGEPSEIPDRRFASAAWRNDRIANFQARAYLVNCDAMNAMVQALQVDDTQRAKVQFAVQQWLDALSPANFFATNPDAQAQLIKTNGHSLIQGMWNFFNDLARGKLSITDETAFEVGRNVGTSAGAVVFENELIQLIQYQPTTPKLASRPMLMVPPCINKFYILDLQPDNSMVQHLLNAGHPVFMVSWRNPGPDQANKTWDDYLQLGVIDAIEVVQKITGQERINMLGFCVGGTILTTALAVLKARKQNPCESLTLLTTFLDFSDTGALGLMVDENFVAYREATIGKAGLLKGAELATTFSFLRPNDLVWNYMVSNYLMGQSPPAFDLLFWNGDSTNLPGPMYCWYLRNTYLSNQLRKPGACQALGVKINLGLVNCPTYVLNTREDHIVPWGTGYQTTQILRGPIRYVLGASGHIAGVINPASKNKRSYWVAEQVRRYPEQAQEWLKQAAEKPGSWWNDWTDWLSKYRGPLKSAPKKLGSKQFPVIEPAPGRYVREPASN